MAVGGGGVVVDPDTEPDFDRIGEVETIDAFDDHFGLIAVGAVEADGWGELREDGYVDGDVVLVERVVQAFRILCAPWGVVHSREDSVEVVVVED